MLLTKFQVSSRPGTFFSKIQIWPKLAVNRVLNVYRPGKCFFSLLGFEFGVMWGCFSDVFGLPYRLASLLIYNMYTPTIVLMHSRGVITLLTICKIPNLKYVFARCAIRL